MKLRSLAEVEAHLDESFGWRRRELTTVRLKMKGAREHEKEIWFRSGVVLLYAHWEGFIKSCAKAYLYYIVRQGRRYSELNPCFKFFAVKEHLDGSQQVNLKNFLVYSKAMTFFVNPLEDKFVLDPSPYISTRENQNLNSEEFKIIVLKLGIEYLPVYELREKLIDEQLMDYRNRVAHGENLHGDVQDPEGTFEVLSEKIINCMEVFQRQVSQAVKDKSFLASASETSVIA